MIGLAGALLSINAVASDANDIETGAANVAVTYDNYYNGSYPVVSAILSQPGTFGGHAYTGWSFLATDATGSIDIFASSATLNAVAPGYSPSLGDALSISGAYQPFDQIPEIDSTTAGKGGALTSVALQSQGNAVPGPVPVTIGQINVQTLPFNVAGYLLQLNNVTIGGNSGPYATTFPTYSQVTGAPSGPTVETYTVSDGVNTMTLFDWVTSYSVDGAMGGNAVPTGPVNMTGFVDVFGSGSTASAEFIPMSITAAVPEPSVMNLCGAGSVLAYVIARLRSKKA